MGLQLQRNGKPYKELVKIAHPPIIRRAARRCAGWSEGFCTQPLRRYRCHGEVRHELYRRALLGFAASGVPGLRRSAPFTSGGAGQTEIPPPDWKAKDLGVGKITKAPCASHAFVADRIAERDGGK